MYKKKKSLFLLTLIGMILTLTSCSIVRPGQVGVKQRLGKVKGDVRKTGVYFLNPLVSKIIKVPVRTINMPVRLERLPSKEGLSIDCELAVMFKIIPESAIKVVETIGVKHGEKVILSVLRSAAADVTAQFFAKDLHTSERKNIEIAISKKMTEILGDRGFVVEAVLLKSIQLPDNLSRAIEEKLQAEQQAETMKFILEKEKQEAERLRIQAEGIKNAQKILSEGLTDLIIKYKSLEVFEKLSQSNNAKIIITDGKTPVLINDGK